MADAISISGLRAQTHIGVTPEEREQPQQVVVDLELEADLRAAGRSDALEDTVDYANVTSMVTRLVEASQAHLLEHLAEDIAEALLRLEGLRAVRVEIAKDPPPVVENVRRISVRIERP